MPSPGNTSYAHIDYSDVTAFARDIARTPVDIAKAENRFYAASVGAVIGMAQAEAATVGRQAAKAAADLKPIGINTVLYGGKGYSKGAEFGSIQYKQFKMWRGNSDDAGYFLWPAIRQFRDKEFRTEWDRSVWTVIQRDFTNRGI